MKATIVCLTILLFGACKTSGDLDSTTESANASSQIMSSRDFFDPTRQAWTGRLIMPKANERKSDGGVWFEVYDAPGGKTFNEPIWLNWNSSSAWLTDYNKRTRVNIRISDADLARVRNSKDVVPERLSGLSQVSFLESLAGARPDSLMDTINGKPTSDSIEVLITEAKLSGNTLTLNSEPVQITGRYVSLLKFIKKTGDLSYSAKSWSGGSFNSDVEVTYQPPRKNPLESASQPTMEGIEKFSANSDGWYAFGDLINGKLEVRALEPRSAMRMDRPSTHTDGKRYIDKENFARINQLKGQLNTAVINKSGNFNYPKNTQGIVVHIFGGISGKDGDPPINLIRPYYGGHFAFGVAKVVKDPFTGQDKLDIEYRQIYGNGPDGVTSGAIKWHNYSGSLFRGWMYARAISDAIIWHPSLSSTYKLGSTSIQPIQGILRELDVMGARFRSGDGHGVAKVIASKSCVQDSNQAAFISMSKFLAELKAFGDSEESLIKAANGQQLLELKKIAEDYRDDVIRFAALREDWREAVTAEIASTKPPLEGIKGLLAAIQSGTVLTPDIAYKKILSIFYNQNATIWFVRTNQIGGYKPDISPTAPGFN
jgi:predicted Abi (CAAX) family protease